jgi:predicted Rdx family selenoprotein
MGVALDARESVAPGCLVSEVGGETKMIDPFTALAAISTAVKLVKTAIKTVQDVESLGPVLGGFFSAKSEAIKVVEQAKTGGFKGSSMGKAVELELAIEQARMFEKEVEMLFFSSNKMDVWQKIVARASDMDREAAADIRRARDEKIKRKEEIDEAIELVLVLLIFFMIMGGTVWLLYKTVN